ncbi:MAG: hypothetical protein V7K98_12310 [Nostoc sp.]|uniref:hypothetical protein n=1 Tax=Nostoc sp. TaxID=1180 RepID=UPI002FF99CA3
MKFDPAMAGFLLALVGSLSGWVAWWNGKRQQTIQKAVTDAEKALNDKRNFDHLVRNQSEISKNIAYGFKDIDEQMADQNNELREIKAWLIRGKASE